MELFNYFGLFLFIYVKYTLANVCYECSGMVYKYPITIDNVPAPNGEQCGVTVAENTCSVRVTWFDDGSSEVHYLPDANLPIDTILTKTERKVTAWSGEYITNKYLAFTCQASNTTPCNTPGNLRRAILSTTWSQPEQTEKFDTLIVPTTDFYGSSCLQVSNASYCPKTNLLSCQQCMAIVQYDEEKRVCAMCPSGKALTNFYEYETTFYLKNQTRSDKIILACRKRGACNAIENIDRIKDGLVTKFDFKKFYRSSATNIKSTMNILLMISIIFLMN